MTFFATLASSVAASSSTDSVMFRFCLVHFPVAILKRPLCVSNAKSQCTEFQNYSK